METIKPQWKRMFSFDSKWEVIFLICLTSLIVSLPLLNFISPDLVSSFTMGKWGKYLCFATLAISLNVLWGYTGLLCLGQCLFFALGGYAFGMYLMLQDGLPGFMQFLGYTKLPAYWEPFHNPLVAAVAALLVPGIVAMIFGFLAFRSRIKGVYFSILTQALTYASALLFFRNEFGFGGNNGFTDFKSILGTNIRTDAAARGLYLTSGLLLLTVYGLVAWMLKTKLGKVQLAIRDSENRVRFSGYSTTHFKVFIFVFSAMVAGAAGALYVPQAGIINPDIMTPKEGLEIVVWVAVGGRGTKYGPIIGAILVSLLKSWASSEFEGTWPIIMGSLFIIVVLFMPDGVVGVWDRLKKKLFTSGKGHHLDSDGAKAT